MFSTCILAQKYNFSTADSLTYDLYLKGNWNELISRGNEIIEQEIDFKTLRQRIGYAWMMKGNYAMSKYQYEKALNFDDSDEISLLYLYFNGLYTGDETYLRYYAGKLNSDDKKTYKIKSFRAVEAIDAEYNFKSKDDINARSATGFSRIGINTELGYNFSLYQSFSHFNQKFYNSVNVNQNGYYALLNWTPLGNLNISGGFHSLSSKIDSVQYNANLLYGKISYKKLLFDGSVSYSGFYNSIDSYFQFGLHAGVCVPEIRGMYIESDFYHLKNSTSSNWVYSESIGLSPFKKSWFKLYSTQGNQLNFVDMNGIYVYNSVDYTKFNAGGTLYLYLTPHLTLFGNYSYDIKYITEYDLNVAYPVHSITGGLIWKL